VRRAANGASFASHDARKERRPWIGSSFAASRLLLRAAKGGRTMKVAEIMTRGVRTCLETDPINWAAQLMWENDFGCVPVVDGEGDLVGIITDRDICMAAYTQGRRLSDMTVGTAASKNVTTVNENDSLHHAEKVMHDMQVRRLPVLDDDRQLVGILSIGDLARRAREIGDGIPWHIVGAIVGISERRSPPATTQASDAQGAAASTSTTTELKQELKKSLELLQTLRDEVRIRLHLGSLDLKEQWKKFEPHLGDVEKKAEELTEASFAAITEAVKRVEKFRSSLTHHH
jgi:CBS domain-containing protein